MDGRQLPKEEVGGKRLGRAEAVKQLLPMALSFVLGGMWTVGHGCHVFQDHPFGVLWALGCVDHMHLSTLLCPNIQMKSRSDRNHTEPHTASPWPTYPPA